MKNQSVAKRSRSDLFNAGIAKYKDLAFPIRSSNANYNGSLGPSLNSSELYKIILTNESAILFCAREG